MAYEKGLIERLAANSAQAFTYKEVGVHYATLNALVNRGLLEKSANGKYAILPKGYLFNRIEKLADGHEFISLRENGKLGMLCSIKGADVLDAWGNPYDYTSINEYRINGINWKEIK